MSSSLFSPFLIPFLTAMFMAVNMGASGTAPSFSAAYGSNTIRKSLIPGLFGLFVFLGAIIAGKKVVLTISQGILPQEAMNLTLTTIILFSVSMALLIANLFKIPQSTSQATVLALVGTALYLKMLNTGKLFLEIIPAWFILPLVSFCLTFLIGRFFYKNVQRKAFSRFDHIAKFPIIKTGVIFTACYISFAIGSNNVANAAGPIFSLLINQLGIKASSDNYLLLLIVSTLLIAPCFGIGSSLLGQKVLRTTGKEIISFGTLGAILISFVTATLLLFASVFKGIPSSLVQTNAAAIIGLAISKVGWKKTFQNSPIKKIFYMWIISPLLALLLSFTLTLLADKYHLL